MISHAQKTGPWNTKLSHKNGIPLCSSLMGDRRRGPAYPVTHCNHRNSVGGVCRLPFTSLAAGRCSGVAYVEVERLFLDLHVCAQDYKINLMLINYLSAYSHYIIVSPIMFKYENLLKEKCFCIFKSASSLIRPGIF